MLSSAAGGIKNPEVAENKGGDTGLNYSIMLPQDQKLQQNPTLITVLNH